VNHHEAEAAAYSINGRTFAFSGPVMAGEQHLGQVLEVRPEPGPTFAEPTVRGTGRLLSDSGDHPFTMAAMSVADPAFVQSRLPAAVNYGALRIGTLAESPGVPAVLHAAGFARHTFVCGQLSLS
jgi:hypothetical protein